MNQNEIIQSLRAEIAKLQRVLDLLLDQAKGADEVRRPGRPKGSGNKAASFNPEEFAPKKRTMSAEGKARIAAAQKKRWAAHKTASPDQVDRKQVASTKKTSKTLPSKSARKVPPTAKKSAAAGKRAGSISAASEKVSAKKTATKKTSAKKTTAKKTSKSATKRTARQGQPTAPEQQTTA